MVAQCFECFLQSPAGIALDKLDSSLIIIGVIILCTKLSGGTLGTIFLKKGNLKKGLTIGAIAFLIACAGAIFMANVFGAQNLTLSKIVPWIPWILVFICGNAFNEELLFRGLFLNKVNAFMGKLSSNLVLILPFVLHHTGVTYTTDALMFLVYLIPLAFAWGYIIQESDSLWGSILFHAGTDIPVILVIFSKLIG
jgi:membrane protease YdiL (CAAX protease family)